MNNYSTAAPASTSYAGASPAERPAGVLDNMREAVNGMHELRARLVQLNRHIRGAQPENSKQDASVPKQVSLVEYVADLHSLLRECHDEINESYNHLGV